MRKNHYDNRCLDREEITPKNKADKVEYTPKKESVHKKSSVNVTIREDWDNNTDLPDQVIFIPSLAFTSASSESVTKTIP